MKGHHASYVEVLLCVALLLFTLWAANLAAQAFSPEFGLFEYLDALPEVFENPLHLWWSPHSKSFLFGAAALYGLGVSYHYATRENRRPGEEHGSAVWADPAMLNRKYMDRHGPNIRLTQHVRLGMDTHRHLRNLNILVVGGSGAGKTRSFCLPGIMDGACSYVCLDPKGEIVRATGHLLESLGYEVKVFNLVDMAHSMSFNPFRYVKDDKDVIKLITNLIRNTTPKDSQSQDPFWIKSEIALLSALMLFLVHEAPPEEQNFSMIMDMLEHADVRENDDAHKSALDLLFDALEEEDPDHIALKQFKVFKQASGKTAKSILISAAVRLAMHNLESIRRITTDDDMQIEQLGERKMALFCVVPDNDSTFNHLIGMLYTSVFQTLYYQADHVHGGRLPVHVRLIMDEFCNCALPDDFEKILSTMRSREISASIIIQNMAQLKSLYKNSWESIVGLCDSYLFLGGNEAGTHEYLSKALGKATIDTRTRGVTKGKSGSSNMNFQNAGRELLTPDEVRMLDNRYAILLIRGERPVIDKKFDLMRHPGIRMTENGGYPPYHIDLQPESFALDAFDIDPDRLEDYAILET